MNNTYEQAKPVYSERELPPNKGLINQKLSDTKPEWSKADKERQALYMAMHLADWAQTKNIARNPEKFYEKVNPILGDHPHPDKVDAYFALTGLAQLYLADKLPPKWREFFQEAGIGLEAGMIGNNVKLGIKAKF